MLLVSGVITKSYLVVTPLVKKLQESFRLTIIYIVTMSPNSYYKHVSYSVINDLPPKSSDTGFVRIFMMNSVVYVVTS